MFFKIMCFAWMIQCSIVQTTLFAACFTGHLDRVLTGIKVDHESVRFCWKVVAVYLSFAWLLWLLNC